MTALTNGVYSNSAAAATIANGVPQSASPIPPLPRHLQSSQLSSQHTYLNPTGLLPQKHQQHPHLTATEPYTYSSATNAYAAHASSSSSSSLSSSPYVPPLSRPYTNDNGNQYDYNSNINGNGVKHLTMTDALAALDAPPSPSRPTWKSVQRIEVVPAGTAAAAEKEHMRETEEEVMGLEEDDQGQQLLHSSSSPQGCVPLPPSAAKRPSRWMLLRRRLRGRLGWYIDKAFDVIPAAADLFVRTLGPILVLAAWSLFAFVTYVYFHSIMPAYGWSFLSIDFKPEHSGQAQDSALAPVTDSWMSPGTPITIVGLFLLFEVCYNHIMAVFTPPGGRPADTPIPPNIDELIAAERSIRRGEEFSKYCRTCRAPKAPRMHHCSICKKCVARMDHHCPWIGGCVGFANTRYFYNFLFWLQWGCIYLVLLTSRLMSSPTHEQYNFLYGELARSRRASGIEPLLAEHDLLLFFTLALTGSAVLAVGGMWGLHTYFIVTNQTTIEFSANRTASNRAKRRGEKWYNPYDLGSWKRNWIAILGAGPIISLWPFQNDRTNSSSITGSSGMTITRTPWMCWSLCSKPFGMATLYGNGLNFELNPLIAASFYLNERGEDIIAQAV